VMLTQAQTLEQIEVASVIAASAFLAVCAALFSRRIARRVAVVFEIGPAKRLKPIAQNTYRALQVYRFRYRALASNVLISMAIVVVTATVWYLVGRAVGITQVSYFTFLLFNPLIAFVLLIPISFNGLGPKEAAVVFFFGLVGVDNANALAMSLLFHVIVVVTSLPGGFVWFSKRRHARAHEYEPSEMLHPNAGSAPDNSSRAVVAPSDPLP